MVTAGRMVAQSSSSKTEQQGGFLLVTGSMRSGTTLMSELLYSSLDRRQRHPDLIFADDSLDILRRFSNRMRAESGTAMAEPDFRVDLTPGMVNDVFRARARDRREAAAVLAARLPHAIARHAGARRRSDAAYGLKTTALLAEFGVLRQALPSARMLILARDPRDVLASNMVRMAHRPEHARLVLPVLMAYEEFLAGRRDDPDIAAVRYEDLATSTTASLRGVLEFARLDPERYDWGSIETGRLGSNSSYGRARGLRLIRRRGVDPRSVGRFREILTPAVLLLAECLTEHWMRRFGYRREAKSTDALVREVRERLLPSLYRSAKRRGVTFSPVQRRLVEVGWDPPRSV